LPLPLEMTRQSSCRIDLPHFRAFTSENKLYAVKSKPVTDIDELSQVRCCQDLGNCAIKHERSTTKYSIENIFNFQ
jgi:hypothetical protein